jgi:hypothetical protein
MPNARKSLSWYCACACGRPGQVSENEWSAGFDVSKGFVPRSPRIRDVRDGNCTWNVPDNYTWLRPHYDKAEIISALVFPGESFIKMKTRMLCFLSLFSLCCFPPYVIFIIISLSLLMYLCCSFLFLSSLCFLYHFLVTFYSHSYLSPIPFLFPFF